LFDCLADVAGRNPYSSVDALLDVFTTDIVENVNLRGFTRRVHGFYHLLQRTRVRRVRTPLSVNPNETRILRRPQ
jgi:hypothetical protein